MTLSGSMTAITDLMELGGPVVMLLACMSVLSLAVFLTKLVQFMQLGVGRHRHLKMASELWDRRQSRQAALAARNAGTYLGPVLAEAMQSFSQPHEARAYQARIEGEMADRFDTLERGFRLLDSIAQTAPLLGLFGTVLGMIDAFQALQGAGAAVDPSVLAGGIWVALLTTAAGLGVAMPTALALTWLETRTEAERAIADSTIRRLFCPLEEAQSGAAPLGNAGKSQGVPFLG